MKNYLRSPLEHMLQGLAYWLAYRDVVYKKTVIEAIAVDETFQILQTHLPVGYKVVSEYPYKLIDKSFGNKHADLAIINTAGICECLIEFKLADNTNGGYAKDVTKLHPIKTSFSNVDCYVVILFRKSCLINQPKELVMPNGKAKRKVQVNNSMIAVRRVYTALRSQTAKRMKRVICIELL